MKSKQITAHFCDHCNKLYQREKAAIQHEIVCNKNPNNFRPCFGCDFLTKKEHSIYRDGYYGENEIIVNVLFCTKKKEFLIPPSVEHKRNSLSDEYEPMPIYCKYPLNYSANHFKNIAVITNEELKSFCEITENEDEENMLIAHALLKGFEERENKYSPFPF